MPLQPMAFLTRNIRFYINPSLVLLLLREVRARESKQANKERASFLSKNSARHLDANNRTIELTAGLVLRQ